MAIPRLQVPCLGPISSPFGECRAYDEFGNCVLRHGGLDIACPTGTSAWAAEIGVVTAIKTGCLPLGDIAYDPNCGGLYGNFILLEHGLWEPHFCTVYAHLQDVWVQPGQLVYRGQVIGTIDSTGYVTGPHIHFELREDCAPALNRWGTRIDPLPYLDFMAPEPPAPSPLLTGIVPSVLAGPTPLRVTFTAAAQGGTPPYTFNWDFGEGFSAQGQFVSHIYVFPAAYRVALLVTDAVGAQAQGETVITVSPAPEQPPVPPGGAFSTIALLGVVALGLAAVRPVIIKKKVWVK